MNFFILLSEIKCSPNIYLGTPSITRLSAFIDGYLLGSGIHEKFLDSFQDWITLKFGIKSVHKWSDILLFFEQSEEKAFWLFFDLLDEFRSNTKHSQE